MVKRLRSVARRKPLHDRAPRPRLRALVERAADDLPVFCDIGCITHH